MRQVDLRVDLDPAAAALPAGPVYPVVANALRNSIEAIDRDAQARDDDPPAGRSPAAGEGPPVIRVAARVHDSQVELTVTDTGPGLDPSLTDKDGRFLFGTTTKAGGHGLGLSLCHEIALGLGGGIELTNALPRGTVLTLRYPVVNVSEPGA